MDLTKDFIAAVTEFVFLSTEIQKSDVIFLPGGSDPRLPEEAAKLFLQGFAPYIIASGRYGIELGRFKQPKIKREVYGTNYETEADFYRSVLMKNDVPEGAIICEDKARFTYENAKFTAALLNGLDIRPKKAILVCKAFHARRAYTYYQNSFPDTEIYVCPVPSPGLSSDDWYKNKKGVERVLGELKRLGEQMSCCIDIPDTEK